ncbi:MAG: serine hydrolase [Clostridia bacterium]|nr:serine hydrolase [Clostridia bacterium]
METKTKISSEWIYKFYKQLDEHNVENHALIMMQGNETVFENYVYPYSAEMPHTLFSVTKSIASTAAGFAIDEGLVSLDTKIKGVFPDHKACESDEWDRLTLKSVLTMMSNKQFSFTQDMTGDYVSMFMAAPFRDKERGFLYSNNDAHMVAAVVQKCAGMNLVDYLTPRLFEPLGIERPFWETNSVGENVGGTGCHLKLRDLAKICRCYADGGKWEGKQVIPEWWTREATSLQVAHDNGKDNGYGYLFWISKGNRFSMDGMFGQRVTYIPKYDAVVASFNACVNDGDFTTPFEEILPEAFEAEPDEGYDKKLAEYLEAKGEKPVACNPLPSIPVGKTFYLTPASDMLAKVMFPAGLIPRSITSSLAKRPSKNLNELSFELSADVLTVRWKEDGDTVTINCGLDGEPRMSESTIKGYPYKIWAYAYNKNGKLNAVVKPLNTLATQYIEFDFGADTVKMQLRGTPSFPWFISKNADQSSFVKNSGVLRPVIMKAVNKVLATTEMPMKFKTK